MPAGVLPQWQGELYEKFNLLVPIYTGKSLNWPEYHFRQHPIVEEIPRDAWTQKPIVLASSHLMRRKDRREELLEAEDWDLLIIDEAHHARRRGAGTAQEKGPNRLLTLLHQIEHKAKSRLLMTATPMQVHPVEIYDLLQILGIPKTWNERAFLDYFDWLGGNPDEDRLHAMAMLFQITEAEYGPVSEGDVRRIGERLDLPDISMKKVLRALRDPNTNIPIKRLNTKQRRAAMAVLKAGNPIRHRMSRYTRNLLREYYKKGLLDSPIAERTVNDIAIDLTPPERALYEAVEDYISKAYQAASPEKRNAVGFVMTSYRRRVASSFHALRRTLENRLEKLHKEDSLPDDSLRLLEDASQDERADEPMGAEEVATLEQEALAQEEGESIQSLLKQVALLGTDSKALRLVDEIKTLFEGIYNAAVVFTQYTDTMEFLRDFLSERLDIPLGCFSGSGGQRRDISGTWSPCKKEEIKRLFRNRDIHLLICTDAAGEGLNLQTSGVIINYDLPWNPMKVEQRIGRIDRIGQAHDKIQVINLVYADTVEADVYFALSDRIGIFNGVVGKLQPILSQLPKEFEASIFGNREQREKSRHQAISNVHALVERAEQDGFDIDEVSDADLLAPAFPEPPLKAAHIEAVLKREELLPPGTECHELEPHTFAIRLPGQKESARITADPAIFDDYFESHQFMVPDSPLFKEMLKRSGAGDDSREAAAEDIDELLAL